MDVESSLPLWWDYWCMFPAHLLKAVCTTMHKVCKLAASIRTVSTQFRLPTPVVFVPYPLLHPCGIQRFRSASHRLSMMRETGGLLLIFKGSVLENIEKKKDWSCCGAATSKDWANPEPIHIEYGFCGRHWTYFPQTYYPVRHPVYPLNSKPTVYGSFRQKNSKIGQQ